MPGKLRVHELAKKLGITSKELLATLKEQGEFVKTASSTIEPPVVKKMQEHYQATGGAKPDTDNKPTPAKPAAKPGAPAPKPGTAQK
ncbi:translation initiation factor IF-2, partial [Corynebacterium efficiens YS-314]